MTKQVHEFTTAITADGIRYVVCAFAEQRGHIWIGWLEFSPASGSGAVRRTGEETSQPSREAVEYWASGLEPVYLEGALLRAK